MPAHAIFGDGPFRFLVTSPLAAAAKPSLSAVIAARLRRRPHSPASQALFPPYFAFSFPPETIGSIIRVAPQRPGGSSQ